MSTIITSSTRQLPLALAALSLVASGCDRSQTDDTDQPSPATGQAGGDLSVGVSVENATWTTVDARMSVSGVNESPERGGFLWRAGGEPTAEEHDGKLTEDVDSYRGRIETTITGLEPGKSYTIAAFAETDDGLVLSSYTVDFETLEGPSVGIGDEHEGGLVVYFLKEDDAGYVEGEVRGLVVAPTDADAAQWGGRCGDDIETETAIGSGSQNTENIVAYHEGLDDYADNPSQCHRDNDGTVAAISAASYESGGFDDWYLPSHEELQLVYRNAHARGLGDFQDTQYWSSSLDGGLGHNINFEDGSGWTTSKDVTYKVRPVRSF